MTYIDEGWMLLSSDIILHLLNNSKTLLCHKGGDIAMAMWIQDLEKTKKIHWFPDNDRIVHHPPVATYIDSFVRRKEICHSFISMHGIYGNQSRMLNDILQKESTPISYHIPPIVDNCPKTYFRWENFDGIYYAKPTLCSTFPLWSKYDVFHGRTGGKYR